MGKSVSKSVGRMGFPVAGWTGFPLGSILETCTGGYSLPGLSSGVPGSSLIDPRLMPLVTGCGVEERARVSETVRAIESGRLICLVAVSQGRFIQAKRRHLRC